jgi:hypothetical protein
MPSVKPANILALIVLLAACRRAPPASEKASHRDAAAPALAPTAVADRCRIGGSRVPLLTRWTSAQREALETAMRGGIAVLAADDCKGARVLSGCRARGRYGYMGARIETHGVDLSTDEELRINAPASEGASDAGLPHMHVDLTVVGARATTRSLLAPSELTGDCAEATHFVRAADVGLERPNADACRAARPGDAAPPAGCNAVVAVRISPISPLEDLVTFDKAPEGAVLNIGVCPESMVVAFRRCVRAPVDAPHLCAFGDGASCTEQCRRGDTNSCDVLGFMLWHGKGVAKDMALAAARYSEACERGDAIGCSNLAAFTSAGEGVTQDRAKAATLFDRACALGDLDACSNLASVYITGDGLAADVARAL